MSTKRRSISRNEYFERMQEAVSIGMRAMEDVEKTYEIAPIDFSRYSLTDTTQKIVNANFSNETADKHGEYMLYGHWNRDLMYQFANICSFDLTQVDGYSSYAFSDEQMATITYCEGDIFFSPYKDKETYEKRKRELIRYYEAQY